MSFFGQPFLFSAAVCLQLFLALLSLFSVSLGKAEEKPVVLATTTLLADLVRSAAGDLVELEVLMGPGVDPHVYKATHGDLSKLADADLVFFNGLLLEGKMTDVFQKLAARNKAYAVAESLNRAQLRAPAEFGEQFDPHVWFDVMLWRECFRFVSSKLNEILSPSQRPRLAQRTEEYLETLENLHVWVSSQIALIPADRRVLITAHDAFGYFGRAYGVEVRGLQGMSTTSEFGLRDVRALADFVIERQIPALFVESSVPKKFIQALRKGVEERGFTVVIGGELFSDALGEPGGPGENYQKMVEHNVRTIVAALSG